MTSFRLAALASAATLVAATAVPAQAVTRVVEFNLLTESGTINTPFMAGDSLFMDTLVTMETGLLTQSITFSVAAGVTGYVGQAAWIISTAAGPGPRLVGVNIDLLDSTNAVIGTDSGTMAINGVASSVLGGPLTAGTYTLRATGTAVRDASLDVNVSFVPEPSTYGLMLAGIGVVGLLARRRKIG